MGDSPAHSEKHRGVSQSISIKYILVAPTHSDGIHDVIERRAQFFMPRVELGIAEHKEAGDGTTQWLIS